MTFYFLETSALAKVYIRERGTGRVRAIVEEAIADPLLARIHVSRLAFPEAMSAIVRRWNQRTVPDVRAKRMRSQLYMDFTSPAFPFQVVEANRVIVDRGALLVAQHRLRAYDAVQLATALSVQPLVRPPDRVVFVCADAALTRAARAEQLPTTDPTV